MLALGGVLHRVNQRRDRSANVPAERGYLAELPPSTARRCAVAANFVTIGAYLSFAKRCMFGQQLLWLLLCRDLSREILLRTLCCLHCQTLHMLPGTLVQQQHLWPSSRKRIRWICRRALLLLPPRANHPRYRCRLCLHLSSRCSRVRHNHQLLVPQRAMQVHDCCSVRRSGPHYVTRCM